MCVCVRMREIESVMQDTVHMEGIVLGHLGIWPCLSHWSKGRDEDSPSCLLACPTAIVHLDSPWLSIPK